VESCRSFFALGANPMEPGTGRPVDAAGAHLFGRQSELLVATVMRSILPFCTALIVALLLVTYVPAFSLTLPRLFGH
jgi:hypothetical protein